MEARQPVECGSIAVYLTTPSGMKVVSAGNESGRPVRLPAGPSELTIDIDALNLNPGRYTASLWMARATGAKRKFGLYDFVEDAVDLVIATPDGHAPEGLVATKSELRVASPERHR